MSVDYDASLVIGWVFEGDNIPKKFYKSKPEKSHMEDRFSEKTGQKIGQIKVVDEEARDVLVLDGKEYDDHFEFFQAIADEVGGSMNTVGYCEDCLYAIEVPRESESIDQISFDDLLKLRNKLISMQEKLNNLGFKVSEPTISAYLDIN